MRNRRFVIGLLGAAAALAALLPIIGVAAPPGAVLPDLVADPPAFPAFQNYTYPDGTQARLLRFDGYVHNRGAGPLEIRGSNRSGNEFQTVRQWVQTPSGLQASTPLGAAPRVIYETADGHNHFHLMRIARYSLWNSTKTAEVAPGQKVGFCLEDSQRIETNGPSSGVYINSDFCRQGNPTASDIRMGVSAGWRDRYGASLALQWVDVSDVQPGSYWLAAEIDTENVVEESNESNNVRAFAASASTVAGYRATAVDAGTVPAGAATTITLTSQTFGTPGARQFRIASLPAGGTLRSGSTVLGVGSTISGSTLTYTPASGFSGPDGFTFSARDSTSLFPRTPATAAVSLNVSGAPVETTVAISGAPASLNINTSAQLTATVTNGPAGVTWSVDGVAGGNATVGTVSASGLYQAPAAVPAGGAVAVRATSTAAPSAFDEKTIQIVNPGPPDPAPDPGANYVTNPSFESNTAGWSAYQASIARTQLADAPNGVWVARLSRTSGTSFSLDDSPTSIDRTVASRYTGAAFVKAANAGSAGKSVRVNLRERTPSGATVRNIQGPTVTLGEASFERVSAGVTADAGNRLEIYISLVGATTGNAFYIDQISLTNGGVGPSPNQPPTAAFTASTLSPQTGQQVTFTDSSSDPDGTIVNREWDLDGDGAFDDATGPTATRTYTSAGDVVVRVRVTDNDGASAAAGRTVSVSGTPGPDPGDNLVVNGSFETSVSGWTSWQASLARAELADAPEGGWAARVTRSAGTSYTIDDAAPTVASAQGGATYLGVAWIKAASASAVGKEVEVFLRERSAAGTVLRNVAGPSFFLTNSFQRITAQLVPQAAGNKIEIYVGAKQAVVGDAFYLDKVSLSAS